MSDQTRLVKVCKDFGVFYDTITEPQFLSERAMKLGARICIGVRQLVDFYFDKSGRLVGTATTQRDSFVRARKR